MLIETSIPATEARSFRSPAPAKVIAEPHHLRDVLQFRDPAINYARNTQIFTEGDRAEYLYLLTSGVVRMTKVLNDGRRQISTFHYAGDLFGLDVGSIHHYSAEAVVACRVEVVARSAVDALASRYSYVARNLWAESVRALERAQDHMLLLGRKTAVERVSSFLLDTAKRKPKATAMDLPMSRSDIADYLGLTIETVSRIFSQLEAKGAIGLPSSRRVELRDKALLEANDCA